MSYQVLARKWRPRLSPTSGTCADGAGQRLSLGRIHHAFARAAGKTSIARLLAKGLNCETGITATPCGQCDNCREIEQGALSI